MTDEQNIEMIVCPDCNISKPITDYPVAKVAAGKPNYYRPDHTGVHRKRNRCADCQRAYNNSRKAAQRDKERQIIAEAAARGEEIALIPLDPKAPKSKVRRQVNGARKVLV